MDVCRVDPGDLLIAKVGDPPGTSAIYPDEPPGIVTQDVIRLKVDSQNGDASYLCHLFNSEYGRYIVDQISVESTRNRIGLGDLKKVRVALPPVTEQSEIANQLNRKTAEIDRVIAREHKLIELLQELRTSLISEVVTGKIDVREAVAA